MIFKDIRDKHYPQVLEAVNQLFDAVIENQTHENDLLLVEINGMTRDNPESDIPFYEYGPDGWTYFDDQTQFRLFKSFTEGADVLKREEFFSDYKSSEGKQSFYDISMQCEMMAYLRFWESDKILKQLYQLTNLALGKPYDWHFSISPEDKRWEIIIKKIRNRIEDKCPKYFQLLKEMYYSQIRNAVAHSKFYILPKGMKVGFTNYIHEDKSTPFYQEDFQMWEDIFHKLSIFYLEFHNRMIKHHNEFISKQNGKEFGLDIRVTKKDMKEESRWIKFVDVNRPDWMWYNTWKKHYKNKK